MFGPWHWKHLESSTSLPGASGNPAALGFCCASAGEATSARMTRSLSIDTDVRFLDHLAHLGDFALDQFAELRRRRGRELEAERAELVAHLGQGEHPGEIGVQLVDGRRRRSRGRKKARPGR